MADSSTPTQFRPIYYPFTSFTNSGWLKASLLYWDGIRRIRPEGYITADDGDAKEAAENGLIDDTLPDLYIEQAEKHFSVYFNSVTQGDSIQNAMKNLPNRHKEYLKQYVGVERIPLGKLTRNLSEQIIASGHGYKRGNNLFLTPELGGLYMSVLASIVSRQIGEPLITDREQYSLIGQEISFDYLPDKVGNRSISTFLFKIGLPLPSPIAMQLVDMKKVIKFHKDYAPERIRFRKAVEDIIKEAKAIENGFVN